MPAHLEFILGILDQRYPAFACHDDFTGPHGRALQLWQRLGFLAREPECHPAASCPHCRDGSPYRLGKKLLCPGCRSTVDPRHLVRWRFDLDAFLSWLAQGLNMKDGVRPVDDRLWHLGSSLLDDRRQECFFRRASDLSPHGRERLLARRNALLISCLPLAPPEGFSGHCLSLLDLLRDDKGSLRVVDLARVLEAGGDVRFDAGGGTLWIGDRVQGHVPPGGKECYFLECLWQHAGAVVPYADIRHHVLRKSGSRDAAADEATYCQKLKSAVKKRIPNIDDVIAATNKGHGYQMLTHAGQREEP